MSAVVQEVVRKELTHNLTLSPFRPRRRSFFFFGVSSAWVFVATWWIIALPISLLEIGSATEVQRPVSNFCLLVHQFLSMRKFLHSGDHLPFSIFGKFSILPDYWILNTLPPCRLYHVLFLFPKMTLPASVWIVPLPVHVERLGEYSISLHVTGEILISISVMSHPCPSGSFPNLVDDLTSCDWGRFHFFVVDFSPCLSRSFHSVGLLFFQQNSKMVASQ